MSFHVYTEDTYRLTARAGRASKSLSSIGYLYSSGPEWPSHMKRIAGHAPQLGIFGAKLMREAGCGILAEEGREYLERLEHLDQ